MNSKKRKMSRMSDGLRSSARLAGLLLGVALLVGVFPAAAQQASKRLILGQVLDPKGKAAASAIVYLLSDRASFVSGELITVAGGD